MTISPQRIEAEFARLEQALQEHAELAQEFLASRQEFFAHRGVVGAGEPAALRRHLEWFLLERYSAGLGGVPLEVLVHRERERAGEEALELSREAVLAALLASIASVFEVTGVLPGEGVWVRDLAGGGEYALEEPEASNALEVADLLVGRLFAVGDALHRLSGGAGIFRDERLRGALEADLERARASRRGSLRLSQAELEKMFFDAPAGAAESGAVERARALLAAAGVPDARVEAMLAALASDPLGAAPRVFGGDDTLGRVLDELAFETQVDLERAREALAAAWLELNQQARSQAPAGARPAEAAPGRRPRSDGAVDVRAAVQAFSEGRNEGRDLEQLFRDLERDLGLDEVPDEAEELLAPDFPGVVGAMVEEYLWDLERERGAAAAERQASLRKLGEWGAAIGVFENLGRRDLLVFTTVWLPELGGLRDAAQARALLAALEGFCAWAQEQQGVPLAAEFEAGAAAAAGSLPRVVEANRSRVEGAELGQGELFEVRSVADGWLSLADRSGELREAQVAPQLSAHLRQGDRVRADVTAEGALRLYCCYPPESRLIAPS